MGGAKGGGGGGETPAFIREGTRDLSQRSQQLFDLARPLLETGTSQIAELIRTGGPGANVPIINQAVAAQRGATNRAQAEIGGDLRRAGLETTPGGVSGGGGAGNRIRSRLQRGGDVAARQIPVRAAAPLVSAAASAAIGGSGAAGSGFQGALGALSSASRVGQQARAQAASQRRNNALSLGRNLVGLANFGADQGFFDFLQRNNAGSSGVSAASPAFQGFTPAPINGGLPF